MNRSQRERLCRMFAKATAPIEAAHETAIEGQSPALPLRRSQQLALRLEADADRLKLLAVAIAADALPAPAKRLRRRGGKPVHKRER